MSAINSSSSTVKSANPGLAPYDLTGYTGIRGRNFFREDRLLQRIFLHDALHQSIDHNRDMWQHLDGYGELVGGILDELTEAAHKEENLGHIEHFDRTGERIDEIRYCAEQIESRKISYQYGVVNLDFHEKWKHPFTVVHRMALAYLMNQNGEGGVSCPMAMTDGMIRAIKELGTPDQKERYLSLIAGEHSTSYFMCGQYVTERVGGSNVGANRTVAHKAEDAKDGKAAKWKLNGEKWFCSNPGDLWVTTARIDGSNRIGLYLVPRRRVDQSKNSFVLLRKKEIIGSRGKLTAECLYEDCDAEELGRPAHGLANLIRYVINISRIHVGSAAIGMSRRALMEALAYSKTRTAYGRRVIDFPVTGVILAKMSILHSAVALANFRSFDSLDKKDPLQELLTPTMKYISTVNATWSVRQSILLHGGNGILSDFNCLPRLLNDAIINETWEGAHPVIQEHAMKALGRERVRKRLDQHFESVIAKRSSVSTHQNLFDDLEQLYTEWKKNLLKDSSWIDLNKKYMTESFFQVYAISLLLDESALDAFQVAANSNLPDRFFANSADKASSIQNENQVFADMAKGLIEIYRFGVDAATQDNGVFVDAFAINRIISYMEMPDS